jgi:S-formylglutathione hydrolase FrmB
LHKFLNIKKVIFILATMMFCGIASAQFAGIQRGQQEERTPKEAAEALKTHDIKHIVYHESQGTAHEWLTWRRALNDFAPRLFK